MTEQKNHGFIMFQDSEFKVLPWPPAMIPTECLGHLLDDQIKFTEDPTQNIYS